MQIEHLDHLVLTVADIPTTCDFYARVLGMRPVTFAGGRTALAFGRQKINLHPHGGGSRPKAARPNARLGRPVLPRRDAAGAGDRPPAGLRRAHRGRVR